MIRLGGLVSQKAFGKFEMGKVISNPFATAFVNEAEGEDHEVSMANNSLDTIIKMATELKAKMGENEKDIPAWIQDHITNAENFISQASSNYHEYGVNEANTISAPGEWVAYLSMTRGKKLLKTFDTARGAKQYLSKNVDKLLGGANVESVGIMTKKQWDEREAKYAIESIKEASPCWKGYKQVGMKDKGGRQVPNCVPNESVVKEATYNFGKEEYTKKNLTPTQIQDLAFGYVQTPITKLVGKTLGHRVNLANDLARLTGTKQLDAKARGKESALIMVLLKNKLISKEEYIQMYKDLIEKHQQVIKYLKNASPEMRNSGGAARAAAKDMKGEFDMD
jgi:hypothetical protein